MPQSFPKDFARTDSNTTMSKRNEFRRNLYENIIRKNFASVLSEQTESRWIGAYWGCEISYYRDTLVKSCLFEAMRGYNERSPEFNRATLEAVYTLYPSGFENEARSIMERPKNTKHFAMAAEYLMRQGRLKADEVGNLMAEKFPAWQNDAILKMLNYRMNKEKVVPEIKALLRHGFWGGKTVVFSFQRENRDFEGLTVIMSPDGKFLRDSSGQIFHISHLARSISNLPGYLTNGNTPEGIYSIQKVDTSNNIFIGKTPLIASALPFEVSPDLFFKDSKLKDTAWSLDLYRKMLPASWMGYFPVYEAFYAGKAGRSEIVMHGTTIDPEFYRNTPYYPNTPSMGCMTAEEVYSPEDGKLILSDQQKLVDALTGCYAKEAYLVVINISDQEEKLQINDILQLIQ